MLDVRALVHAEEAQRLLIRDPVAIDQPLDLGRRDAGKLAFIGVKRAEAGGVGSARERAEGVDQRLRFRVERLGAHALLALAKPASEHQPQRGVALLAGLDPFFLGEVLGQHAPAVAVRAGAVHGADRARERLDMVEILPGVSAQACRAAGGLRSTPDRRDGRAWRGRRPWRRLRLETVMLASL